MSNSFDDPFGLGAPRQRLDEAETVERMLATGARMVGEAGLRISFDLLRLEDVIAEAGVSRSAVYKRWPRKEQYYGDLLLRLAGRRHPALAAYDTGTPAVVISVALENIQLFRTPAGRRKVLTEMCRLGALRNFDALRERTDWRIYMALHATMLSLPENEYRTALVNALRRSEESFITRMCEFYALMLVTVGYEFKDKDADLGMAEFTLLGAAAVEGVLLTSGTTTELTERRFSMDPFSVGEAKEWSYPAISFASLVFTLFEQHDLSEWPNERVAQVEAGLRAFLDSLAEHATMS